MRFLYMILGMCLLAIQVSAADFRLAVLGDSLSAGHRLSAQDAFYTQLQKALHTKGYTNVFVIHASKSGETTAGGVKKVSSVISNRPNGVILELGINDALRGEPIHNIQSNLSRIIERFQSAGIPVMLIGMQVPPLKNPSYARAFNNMYQELSRKYGLILYPNFMQGVLNFNPVTMRMDQTYVLADGVHPNAEGVKKMVQNVLPDVIAFLQENGVKE